MNWKWGGPMNNKCIYYVEGECEEQLINALKLTPSKLIPGKVRVYNVIQKLIPKSQLLMIQPGTMVTFVFDTDVPVTEFLQKNIALLGKYCGRVKIVYLPQVLNLEDELVRCSDVRAAEELTKSKGRKNFKADFCRLKVQECRNTLERHHLSMKRLWVTKVPEAFSFAKYNADLIKQ